jgi:hypothetical protein
MSEVPLWRAACTNQPLGSLGSGGWGRGTDPGGVYPTEHMNHMVSLKSIDPQTRQLNFTIPSYKIKCTSL